MTCNSKIDPPAKVGLRNRLKREVRRLRRRPAYADREVRLFGALIWMVLWMLRWTTWLECRGMETAERSWAAGRPVIFAFWHGRAIMLPFSYHGPRATIMNSTHRDGRMITEALRRFGFACVRGSTTRGSVGGTLGLLRALRDGSDVALIPDGPRGPAGRARAGAAELAAASGAPLLPMAFSASRGLRLRSWDRMMIPLPFSRVVCVVGEPVEIASGRRPSRDERERLREELERRLCEVTRAADRAVGRDEDDC